MENNDKEASKTELDLPFRASVAIPERPFSIEVEWQRSIQDDQKCTCVLFMQFQIDKTENQTPPEATHRRRSRSKVPALPLSGLFWEGTTHGRDSIWKGYDMAASAFLCRWPVVGVVRTTLDTRHILVGVNLSSSRHNTHSHSIKWTQRRTQDAPGPHDAASAQRLASWDAVHAITARVKQTLCDGRNQIVIRIE